NPGDNLHLYREGSVWFGGSPASEKFDDEDAFYAHCEAVMKQVITFMQKDYAEARLATDLAGATLQRSDMLLRGTKFIGCELLFSFIDNSSFEFNEDQWNEE